MPGWIIQGVRGEGKSLAAVHMMRQYMMRGRPVATNLDLYLDELLPEDNKAVAYRLPDWPRSQDFEALPVAFDPLYKDEDKNGLLVLDESALWLNSRQWNDKDRQKIINWLLQSRKDHWDLILLCQDHDMIDNQIKVTCCDYLVQATRTDRKTIPFFGKYLKMVGLNHKQAKRHLYAVYYGFSGLDDPEDQFEVNGPLIYDGYDTNQKFKPGLEYLKNGGVVDMRALYCYLPAAYLTKHVYIEKFKAIIADILAVKPLVKSIQEEVQEVKRKNIDKTAEKMKLYFLGGFLVLCIGWGYWSFNKKVQHNQEVAQASAVSTSLPSPVVKSDSVKPGDSVPVSLSSSLSFVDTLMNQYRPRLSGLITSARGSFGQIEFYNDLDVVERFTINELRSFGLAVIVKPYGVDVVTNLKSYKVTSWPLADHTKKV
jgi:hypothetical protein